jgi:hypothetical protein
MARSSIGPHFHVLAEHVTPAKTDAVASLIPNQTVYRHVPFDVRYASTMGIYWNAVDKAEKGDTGDLEALRGAWVRDRYGNGYRLLTDINQIHAVYDDMGTNDWGYEPRDRYAAHELRRMCE